MRIAGEEAVGIYMTAYPAFIFFLSLVQLGVPIAIAKVIAELEAKGQSVRIPSVMKTATFITILTAVVFIPASILFVPYLSETLLGNAASSTTLYVGIAIVPIAAIGGLDSGVFPRYCTNRRNSLVTNHRTNYSELHSSHGFYLHLLVADNTALSCRLCDGYYVLAEMLSVLYLLFKYRQQKKRRPKNRKKTKRYPMEPLLAIALPSSGSRLFGTFTWFLEPIIFLRALALSGVSAVAATSLYGIVSGVLVPLLLFPAFIPYALSVVLVPAVSGAAASTNNTNKLKERIHLSLRLSALTGTFAATVFYHPRTGNWPKNFFTLPKVHPI